MRRNTLVSFVSLVAILLGSTSLPAAAASVPPPSGTITCVVAGTGTIKPPLRNTPSTKKLVIAATASGSSCDNTNVTGGKAPITAATVKFSLTEPETGYTCSNYDLGYDKSKLQVKWQETKANGRRRSVAVNNTKVDAFTVVSTDPVVYKLVSTPITKGAFAGSTITLLTALDQAANELLSQCSAGISGFTFGNAHQSQVSVP